MPGKTPLVSIIIPTFNRAHLIGETLDSVLAQTYENWECIVVDDGSTDHTDALMEKYTTMDSRFQYHHRPKDRLPGGNAARNYGFEVSKGEYLNWLDSDDLFSKRKIELQIRQITKENTELAICKWAYIGANFGTILDFRDNIINREIYTGLDILYYYGIEKTYLPTHNFLLSRKIIPFSGLWNEWLTVNQDGEFFARVLMRVHYISKIFSDDCVVLYRRPNGKKNIRISSEYKARQLISSWGSIHHQLLIVDNDRFSEFIDYTGQAVIRVLSVNYGHLLKKDLFYFKFRHKIIKRKICRSLKNFKALFTK